MPKVAVLSCLGLVWCVSCGSDEVLSSAQGPAPVAAAPVEAGVDACAALSAMLAVPGVPERLCAFNQRDDPAAVRQCRLCAASASALEALFPELSCPGELRDCPVSDSTLRACFSDVGQIMVDTLPDCGTSEPQSFDTSALGLRILTSDCGPVLRQCPALQELVLGLVSATF